MASRLLVIAAPYPVTVPISASLLQLFRGRQSRIIPGFEKEIFPVAISLVVCAGMGAETRAKINRRNPPSLLTIFCLPSILCQLPCWRSLIIPDQSESAGGSERSRAVRCWNISICSRASPRRFSLRKRQADTAVLGMVFVSPLGLFFVFEALCSSAEKRKYS